MSMALWRGLVLSFAGQTWTQSVQPVQSSAATCRVYFWPGNSLDRKATDLKVSGAPTRPAGSRGYATGSGTTRLVAPTASGPSLKIRARRPPLPRSHASAPGATACSIQ